MTKDEAEQIVKLGYDHPIVRTVLRLDREVGEVRGELRWIKIVTVATFGGVLGQYILNIF